MQSRKNSTRRQRIALVAFTSLWLGACGGGGGGGDPVPTAAGASSGGPSAASSPAPSPSAGAPAAASGPAPASPGPVAAAPGASAPPTGSSGAPVAAAPSAGTTSPAVVTPPPTASAPTASPAAPQRTPTVQGTDGPDTLEASSHPAVMVGGKGDDVYIITDPADVVIEQAEGGVDEVRTSVGYTLPSNVENMSVSSSNLLGGGNALVGNSLNNRITGAPFTKADIFGLDGDDILDAGGRYGAYLDGGMGKDTLINNIGESRGGPGADLFVVSPRRAMTAPDAPLTVLDFTPDEGDRIDGSFLAGGDPAALFASGHLRFDAVNQRLIYTHEPGPFDTKPSAVEQIILLPGVTAFDPAWIIRR